jgi:hypothetical protein
MTIMYTRDAQQQAMAFLIQQAAHIESQVYQIKYPDIQYPNLVPVDTTAGEWARVVTFFSEDKVGKANWFHHEANDTNRAEVKYEQFNENIHMAEVGYGYTLDELGYSAMIPGRNLSTDRASAARRAYEEFVDRIVLLGDADKNLEGLVDHSSVTAVSAAATGTSNSPDWSAKTADQILTDVNTILTGMYVATKTVQIADTLLLPVESFALLTTKRVGDTTMTVMQYLMLNNIYTATTGQQLTIRAVRGLETAGDGGTGRMVAYRRSPEILKFHLPMPHRFLPAYQTGPLRFDVPGIFRLGGLEIRQPGGIRYMDDIIVPATA